MRILTKRGFTIAEFIVSIMFMFLIIGAAVSIPMKKAKETKHNIKQDGIKACSCNTVDNKIGSLSDTCEFEFETTGRFEFYTVQILGGGAAGGAEKGGAAGEAKIIHYPTMGGKYLVKLGAGGIANSSTPHGGNTVIYKLNDSGEYELFEFARGGVSGSREKIDTTILSDPAIADELKKGEIATFANKQDSATGSSVCGVGGDANKNGQMGEVVIKW